MIDTHCHLTHPRLRDDEEGILARARHDGLTACISIGTGIEDGENVFDLIRRWEGYVYGTAGLDPFSAFDARDRIDEDLQRLLGLHEDNGFVAVGEIGLDYHYHLDPRPVQMRNLERQLELAVKLRLPVVIHVRDAHDDMTAILAGHSENHGVIHSFTAGPAEAERYLDLGWHLAFNGVLTFPKAEEVREAARLCPVDRLVVESDSPYLAPVPVRGKCSEPAYVAHTLRRLAEVRGVPVEEMDSATTANARNLFGI